MRTSHAATALAAFTAGLTVAATLRRLPGHRLSAEPAVTTTALPSVAPSPEHDAVVLPFARPFAGQPHHLPDSPARCGDSGGLTKTGAPCGARATTGSRCHHHPRVA
ncbi:hypothetical protein GCU60_19345 [Blastococcus saxobsidens]|uniref:Secreted protein n=1 Tax=Blastococcus saxobsidens TaxID=138336 RepID=A0A6L9W8R4_9ACTN|nr:hypothetical protein [Blastococcus saxobsidens]NEK87900.1 hypothetical protein [Blastococcus saxobsidens]